LLKEIVAVESKDFSRVYSSGSQLGPTPQKCTWALVSEKTLVGVLTISKIGVEPEWSF